MSETSTLISCTGKITRSELAQIPIPPSTATHVPIPHAAVVEALVDTLSHRQTFVVDDEFAISKNGIEMFGVLVVGGSLRPMSHRCAVIEVDSKLLGESVPWFNAGSLEVGKPRSVLADDTSFVTSPVLRDLDFFWELIAELWRFPVLIS
jgi:hypothetical protein